MKKTKLLPYLAAISTALFSAEADEEQLVSSFLTRKETPVEKDNTSPKPLNKGYLYLKGGLTPDLLTEGPATFFGLGYRSKIINTIHGAIDVNLFQFSGKEFLDSFTMAIFFPTISYQYYFSPKGNSSFFAGIGGSYGGLMPALHKVNGEEDTEGLKRANEDIKKVFVGTSAVITFGYNLNMKSKLLNSLQLDVFYPMTNINEKATEDFSDPLVAITYSIGY